MLFTYRKHTYHKCAASWTLTKWDYTHNQSPNQENTREPWNTHQALFQSLVPTRITTILTSRRIDSFCLVWFFFFWPVACRSSWARDWPHATGWPKLQGQCRVLNLLGHQGTPVLSVFNFWILYNGILLASSAPVWLEASPMCRLHLQLPPSHSCIPFHSVDIPPVIYPSFFFFFCLFRAVPRAYGSPR